MSNRLFSETELAEMGKRTLDRVCDAIEAGDKDGASPRSTGVSAA